MSSTSQYPIPLSSLKDPQRLAAQKELTQILKPLKHDLTLNGIFALCKDGVFRSLTADRSVVDAVALRPELIKAMLDRMPYKPQNEIDYRGVDGTKVPKEQWFHPDKNLLPPPFVPPEERRNFSAEQLEENRKMLENRQGCEPQVRSDYDLGIKSL
ncbi:uncharacterized protein LY89DRAFT_683917 [Mollisia scopiformis]|uniref:Uncharacterized protein n=1 Tax=Mollisia scopiformis TaxID=149040 RepID=A0A194XCN5_MOLSC|nr:uncharacterized protein LY89DRAFT_683917 [Mollisia scopiformis]KUJ17930.1 hypothetical protein LY89DRAFT_683917 [Mollisia scopiformis]